MSATATEMNIDEMVRLINPERVAEIVSDTVGRGFPLTDDMVIHAACQSLQEQVDLYGQMLGVRREQIKEEIVRLAFYS